MGERFRKTLVERELFDRCRKICSDDSHVYLPVLPLDQSVIDDLSGLGQFELLEREFLPEEIPLSPEDLLGRSPSFEQVGDIAIVEPERAEEVASALMRCSRSIKTVIAPISDVEGEFRTRRFRHVAGEPRTVTVHKEHGIRYRVDLEGAYFSPRLGTERLRVASLVHPGEVVLDLFAGVGPFALLMAKRGARLVAVDKNPVAVKYLRENAILNKVELEIQEGDASEIALQYPDTADHVIMNLPHSASMFLAPAMRAAKNGGTVHYYAIAPEDDLYRDHRVIEAAAAELNISVEFLYQGIVRSYAPHRFNVVIDFRVAKADQLREWS
jgi:tRNA (guanine37-N1)-methyltransferase